MPTPPFHVAEGKGVLKGTQGEGLVHSNAQLSFVIKNLCRASQKYLQSSVLCDMPACLFIPLLGHTY